MDKTASPFPGWVNQLCTDFLFTKQGTNLCDPLLLLGGLLQHRIVCWLVGISCPLLGRHVWAVKEEFCLCNLLKFRSSRGMDEVALACLGVQDKWQASLYTTSLDLSGLVFSRTSILVEFGDFDWVRPCPYFLTTSGFSKLWDLRLLPHSYVQVLSQPVSTPHWGNTSKGSSCSTVPCWCDFCWGKAKNTGQKHPAGCCSWTLTLVAPGWVHSHTSSSQASPEPQVTLWEQ